MSVVQRHVPKGMIRNYHAGQRWFKEDLINYDLDEQVLVGLKTYRARCENMSAKGAHLENSTWELDDLTKARFAKAGLTKARFFGVTGVDADFRSAFLDAANFDRSILTLPVFELSTGQTARFVESKISIGNFSFSTFTASEWQHAILERCNFNHASLVGANFYRSALVDCVFTWVDGAAAIFRRASAPKVDFSSSRFPHADFSGANLAGAKFRQAELTGTTFIGTDLRDVDFTDCFMPGARFDHAILIGAKFTRGQLDQANLKPIEKAFKQFLDTMTEKHLTIIWIELINGRIEGSFKVVEGNATRGSDPGYFAKHLGPQIAPFIPWDRVRGDRAREAERAKTILHVTNPKGLAERWISGIRQGMTRENNAIVYKTHQWIVEWLVDTYGEGVLHENIPGLVLERPGPERILR